MHGHTSWVNDLLVLEDGKILSGAKDHRVKLWMSDSGRCTSVCVVILGRLLLERHTLDIQIQFKRLEKI